MDDKYHTKSPTIAFISSSIIGGLSIDFASTINDPSVKNLVLFCIPGLTIGLSFLIRVLTNFGLMSGTQLLATISSRSYFKELGDQLSDPNISPETKKQLQKEYEEAKQTILKMKKGSFKILSAVNETATTNTETEVRRGIQDEDRAAAKAIPDNNETG